VAGIGGPHDDKPNNSLQPTAAAILASLGTRHSARPRRLNWGVRPQWVLAVEKVQSGVCGGTWVSLMTILLLEEIEKALDQTWTLVQREVATVLAAWSGE
jgi:hypothetical protein